MHSLSESIVTTYLRVMRTTRALAHEYGFAYAFFWQPQLVAGTKPLTADERAVLETHQWLPRPVRGLTDAVYDRMAEVAETEDLLVDLADVFSDFPDRVYIDPAHITSVGNRIVAQAMLDQGLRRMVITRAASVPNSEEGTSTTDQQPNRESED